MKSTLLALACAATCGSVLTTAAQTKQPCTPSGGLSFVCGVENAEDLVLVPNSRWMVASGMAPGSGLHIVDTQAKTVRNLYSVGAANARADKAKYASCPGPLDAKQAVLHGLAIRPAANGRYTVRAGDDLWLGSFFADRLAYRRLKP